jgi:hypothetical protein
VSGRQVLALCLATLIVSVGATDASPAPVVLVGAGDIASCSSSGDTATASLVDKIPGTAFTIGDNAYNQGTASEYANCYVPTWGGFKSRTKPAVGDNEYLTSGAKPYYDYYGAAAGDPANGWYSYNAGAWHVVVLNSNCTEISGCGKGSPQERWLWADLTAAKADCIAAVWHEPRFSSVYGNSTKTKPFWDDLYHFGADIVLNGHHHAYERFAPQDPDGKADPKGIREFIVGTGGSFLVSSFQTVVANSQVRNNNTYGVIKLTLGADSYDWEFVPVAGKTFRDSGSSPCRSGAPSPGPGPDPGPPTSSTVFHPSADSRVEKDHPKSNFGSAAAMKADASPGMDMLVRFDVSGLTGSVNSAKLRFYVTNGSSDGPALYPAATGWPEAGVTWNSRPSRTGAAAGDLGAVNPSTWVEYDVTSLVRGNGPVGFDLASVSGDGTEFATKEAGANGPQLVVTTAPTSPTTSSSTTTSSTTTSTTPTTTTLPPPDPQPDPGLLPALDPPPGG